MFTPRWMVGHVVVLIVVVTCIRLGDWQWDVSRITHSVQNFGYALQWPFFAVFFAVMWWRMLRLESRRLDEEAAGAETAEQPVAEQPPADVPQPAEHPPAEQPAEQRPVEKQVAKQAEPAAKDPEDEQLAAYNRMLAALAAEDRKA